MMELSIYLLLLLAMIPGFVSIICIPYWTRKTESFGVSIPENVYHRPEVKTMRKKYASLTGILSIIVIAAFSFVVMMLNQPNEKLLSILFSIFLIAFLIVSFLIYLFFHHKMKRLKMQHKEWSQTSQLVVISTQFRNQKLTYSNLWFALPFVIAITTMILTIQNYALIPDQIPMQYNFSGLVTKWAAKSYRSVLFMPIMQVYLLLVFIFINAIIAKAKQQVNAENPEESLRQNIIFRRRWSAYLIAMGSALTISMSINQLALVYPINERVVTILPIIIAIVATIGAIILSITTGQGGSRIGKESKAEKEVAINRDDDKYWKLGQFYFNKNDPALFLEKRFGVGWTNNWAHPLSWIILIGIIAGALAITFIFGS